MPLVRSYGTELFSEIFSFVYLPRDEALHRQTTPWRLVIPWQHQVIKYRPEYDNSFKQI